MCHSRKGAIVTKDMMRNSNLLDFNGKEIFLLTTEGGGTSIKGIGPWRIMNDQAKAVVYTRVGGTISYMPPLWKDLTPL